jgi:RNase P/RNase MRP subunit p30
MLSYMQIIEVAKMLGASESEARAAVSIANRSIVTGEIQ